MITEPTVFIIGAGASRHLDYPTGNELKDRIVKHTSSMTSEYHQLLAMKFSSSDLNDFSYALSTSGKNSVDAFLEHRTEFLDIGKATIAIELIKHEVPQKLHVTDKNWIQYVYNKMNSTFEEFTKNNVAFITFNYDRAIESYFYSALKSSYRKSEEEITYSLQGFRIIHVHGILGKLDWQVSGGRPYFPTTNTDEILLASKEIKIIHELSGPSHEFKQAEDLLTKARHIYFLGFGYDTTNLKRLNLPFNDLKKNFHGSGFGLTELEAKNIFNTSNRRLKCEYSATDCLSFLRTFVTLK